MSETGFPGTYSTTTVTQTSTTTVSPNIRFDPSYVRTIPGMLKIAIMGLNILGFICIMVSEVNWHSRANWFNFCAMGGFWITGILLAFYLFHVIEKLYFIPWIMLEMGYCGLWCFFMLTASAACAAQGSLFEAWAAASFFGFLAMIIYGVDAFFKFKAWRAGDIAQGERVRSVQKSETVGTPAY
ncbi:hypothetical protein GHT06_017616 [Daphnia sinensis]|uniref:MARVEL domain-containing protein n=1 Tax=Daphnia sinensis TaxID=1820382 RepID=A0AAD5L319_9CRUS|nr:hypothetical protein GHT06_017616 [Daphnia sinensis]